MRFVFTRPPGKRPGCCPCRGMSPLENWQDERLVEIRQRGISPHVVRFVIDDGVLYALKELARGSPAS